MSLNTNTTPAVIVNKIVIKNGLYNGHPSLVDAFLSLIPDSEKTEGNDNLIESIFNDVKRNINSNENRSGSSHWALVS
ncbi:MAG: hypothetical protein QM504_05445 [Pseudomonadota bacterium]